jgi:uncharacterized membrane protein YozB (DUF420 family)
MHGFLGTKASLLSDVSLLLETVIVIAIVVGWRLGKTHKGWRHHWIMLFTVVVDVGFLIVYMLRRLLEPTVLFPSHGTFYFAVYLPVVMVHSIISSVAFIAGIVLTVQGIRHGIRDSAARKFRLSPDYRPGHVGWGKWTVWFYLLSGVSGIAVYLMLYL